MKNEKHRVRLKERAKTRLKGQGVNTFETPHYRIAHNDRAFLYRENVKLKELLALAIGEEGLVRFTPTNRWEECRSDGNIFDTVEGDPIWCFNEDDCGGYARKTLAHINNELKTLGGYNEIF